MRTEEIAGLLQPFLEKALPERCLAQISIYIDLLSRWNSRINLTAIRDPREIVTRHFGESLFLARHLFPSPVTSRVPHPSGFSKGGGFRLLERERLLSQPSAIDAHGGEVRALDIGSGAGFPGLPLKIWAPAISLTLIESNHKKATFLREVARALTLTDVNVLTARAESLVSQPDSGVRPRTPSQPTLVPADVVTLRAVERFDTILPTAARLVAPGGRLALLIGASQVTSVASQGIPPATPIPIPLSDSRVLSIHVLPS